MTDSGVTNKYYLPWALLATAMYRGSVGSSQTHVWSNAGAFFGPRAGFANSVGAATRRVYNLLIAGFA